jgi:hypothetical protein
LHKLLAVKNYDMSSALFRKRFANQADYAGLPDVPAVRGIFRDEATYVALVGKLMKRHNVEGKLALLAVHKHFEVPADSVLLLEEVRLPGGDLGEVVHPIPTHKLGQVYPVAFFFDGEMLQPFKYSRGAPIDMTPFDAFVVDYVALAKSQEAGRRFALKFPNVSPTIVMAEGEIPHLGATVLVPARYIHDIEVSDVAAIMLDECSLGELHAKDSCDKQQEFTNHHQDPYKVLYEAAVAVIDAFPANGMYNSLEIGNKLAIDASKPLESLASISLYA